MLAKRLSLSKKLILMCVSIGLMVPMLGGFVYLQSRHVAQLNRKISDIKLAKTKELGEMVFKFRDMRIEVRTIPVKGMSWADIDAYSDLTKKAVSTYKEAQSNYAKRIESEAERSAYTELDRYSQDFLEFGDHLLQLASTHDQKNLDEIARLVREVCPVKAAKVEKAIAGLIDQQTMEASDLVKEAHQTEDQATWVIVLGSIIGFSVALVLGSYVAKAISKTLTALADQLTESSVEVSSAAGQVSDNGNRLSTAAEEQAAALQETVSAIEQISSMIAKNSENAQNSQATASESRSIAETGKEMVNELIAKVKEIQKSTNSLVEAVERGNQEVNQVVGLIAEIEQKTKVINDIVFQTKLLSFNASVEAGPCR